MLVRKFLKYTFYILLTWFLSHTIYVTIDGLTLDNKKSDLAVILGNKVNTDGTLSKRLEERLKCGLKLYNSNRVKQILVSGGLGKEGFYEGTKMKDYLVKNGVPLKSIIIDNEGVNTIATVENTLKLKDSLNFESVVVISQFYHLTRTKMLFKNRNFKTVTSESPKYFELRDLYSLTREFVAYYVQY